MDTFYHAFWGMTIVREPSLFPLAFIASNLPDFIGSTPHWATYDYKIALGFFRGGIKEAKKVFDNLPAPEKFMKYYRSSHSLLSWMFFSLFLYIFFPSYLILSLCYLSHIIIDIFTHSGVWATRIFYPFSDFHIKGINWLPNLKVIGVCYAILLGVNIVLLFV